MLYYIHIRKRKVPEMSFKNLDTYELLEEKEMKGISSKGYLLEHKKSKARVVLIQNEDKNKVFSIGFRTPASDSTGVPHIMEHSVLCGSNNFPAKDPFVELVKGSLNTFLNAMTYPDKTVYPVASLNDKDFQNLMHVYLDAVFHPNIYVHDEIFRQEGWSYHLDSKEEELTLSGVVYNEMKGAFSSPEGVLDRVVLNTLFPDTSYSNESGGDPDVIPTLTYEAFLDFHRTYYHPSNSYIYLYGDMDFEEKLVFIDENYLCHYDAINPHSKIALQKPFTEVVEKEIPYSIASEDGEEDATYLSYNRVIGTNLDAKLGMAFDVISYVLLQAPGAILTKTLIEAGIGNDIMGSYDSSILQPIFSIVAKGANISDKERFLSLVDDTLKKMIAEGIDEKAIAAGINYYEFRYREADFGSYPKGLMYGLQILDSWIYDDKDVLSTHADALEIFAFLKEQNGTGYFEALIEKYLLYNTHGAVVSVIPEKGRTTRLDQKLKKELEAYKNSLSKEELESVVANTRALKEFQEAPEKEEDVKKIPVLKREDIKREIEPIQNKEEKVGEVSVVYHEVDTSGIAYLNLIFKIPGIDKEMLPYLGILQAVLGLVDTENYSYAELSNEINVHTGGIGTDLDTYVQIDNLEGEFLKTFEFKTKALFDKIDYGFAMVEEIIRHTKLSDEKRIKEIISMAISRLFMRFQQAGHQTAVLRATSYESQKAAYQEAIGGIDYYNALVYLRDHFDEEKETLIKNLKMLAAYIFRKENLLVSYTASKEGENLLEEPLKRFCDRLYQDKIAPMTLSLEPVKKNEGFKTASKVQYVAWCGNFIKKKQNYTGALQILKVILSYDYLWKNLRVKGGAYGCMSGFNRGGGGYFASYRDPHLKGTLDVYKGISEYIKDFEATEEELTKYIIGTMSNLDHPMNPVTKGERSMNLFLSHITEDMLIEERNQVLDATIDDIRELYKIIDAILESRQICVVGSEEKINECKDVFMEIKGF